MTLHRKNSNHFSAGYEKGLQISFYVQNLNTIYYFAQSVLAAEQLCKGLAKMTKHNPWYCALLHCIQFNILTSHWHKVCTLGAGHWVCARPGTAPLLLVADTQCPGISHLFPIPQVIPRHLLCPAETSQTPQLHFPPLFCLILFNSFQGAASSSLPPPPEGTGML